MAAMSQGEQAIQIETVSLGEVAEALAKTHPFSQLGAAGAGATQGSTIRVDRVRAGAGAVLMSPGDPHNIYCVLLEGEIRVERPEPDGSYTPMSVARAGEGFGETPLLIGKTEATFLVVASRDSVLI